MANYKYSKRKALAGYQYAKKGRPNNLVRTDFSGENGVVIDTWYMQTDGWVLRVPETDKTRIRVGNIYIRSIWQSRTGADLPEKGIVQKGIRKEILAHVRAATWSSLEDGL